MSMHVKQGILLLWHSAQHSAHHYGCNVIDRSSCSLSEPAGLQVLLLLYNTSHTMYGVVTALKCIHMQYITAPSFQLKDMRSPVHISEKYFPWGK